MYETSVDIDFRSSGHSEEVVDPTAEVGGTTHCRLPATTRPTEHEIIDAWVRHAGACNGFAEPCV